MSDNDKYQSGWYESEEGHAFHAHGKDMSPETLAALKKLADAAYKHLESLPDDAPGDDDEDEEEDVCRNCGAVKELVTGTPFCKMCYVMLDDDDNFDELDCDDGDCDDLDEHGDYILKGDGGISDQSIDYMDIDPDGIYDYYDDEDEVQS